MGVVRFKDEEGFKRAFGKNGYVSFSMWLLCTRNWMDVIFVSANMNQRRIVNLFV